MIEDKKQLYAEYLELIKDLDNSNRLANNLKDAISDNLIILQQVVGMEIQQSGRASDDIKAEQKRVRDLADTLDKFIR